jgi:hypothetical protein
MAQPIYKLFTFKPTEAWYQLPEDEKKKHKAHLKEALENVGGTELILCFSGWNSEQILGWGVEQFPNIDAVQKYQSHLLALHWFRYFESSSYLGTKMPNM